jgi:hypothetical protein
LWGEEIRIIIIWGEGSPIWRTVYKRFIFICVKRQKSRKCARISVDLGGRRIIKKKIGNHTQLDSRARANKLKSGFSILMNSPF